MELTLFLHDEVTEGLENLAGSFGVTAEEYARGLVGAAVRQQRENNPESISEFLDRLPEIISVFAEATSGMANEAMARAGNLKCTECTQPIDLADVKMGECRHCGSRIGR